MKSITAFGLALALFLGGAPTAFAQGINIISDTSIKIEGSATTEGGTTSDAEAGADVSIDVETDANVSAEGVGITITRDSVSENNSETAVVTAPAMVETSSDLSAYASTVVKTDEYVDGTELSENAVSLRYKQRAMLFRVIPVFVSVKATVESNGDVSVSYPWYGFMLAKKERAALESKLSAAVNSSIQNNNSVNANAALSSRTQAELLEKIHATLKQNLEASLAAEAATETDVK